MIIISGFEPFGKEKTNPSMIIAEKLNGEKIGGHTVEGVVLPVSYRRAKSLVENIIRKRPFIYLATGLSPRITCLRLEVIAVNVAHSTRADNDGYKPFDEKIYENGELAYRGTLPFKKILNRLKEEKIPAILSYHAGTYLCNYVYYIALYNAKKYDMKIGFVHMPHMTENILANPEYPSLPEEILLKAIKIILEETVKNELHI